MKNNGPRRYTPQQALAALQKYCATQERCHEDVRQNLIKHQVYGDDLEEVIFELIQGNFLNEERYAEAFVRGKFKMKQWGRIKIVHALKFKKISEYCINKGLEEIEEEIYLETLNKVLLKKYRTLSSRESDPYICVKKLSAFAISKGYEQYLVFPRAKTIVFEEEEG